MSDNPSGFSLKIKGFQKYPNPTLIQDSLMKELKEKFGKTFVPPNLTPTTFSLFNGIVNDELILSELLTLD